MNKNTVLIHVIVTLTIMFVFAACFDLLAGNDGKTSLTINLEGSARTLTGFNNAVNLDDLNWTITLTNTQTNQVIFAEINADGTRAIVPEISLGSWDILVEVTIFEDRYPYAKGEDKGFKVNPGPNKTDVYMERIDDAIILSVPDGYMHEFPSVFVGGTADPLEITVLNFSGNNIITTHLENDGGFIVPDTIDAVQDGSTTFVITPITAEDGTFNDTLTLSVNGNEFAAINLSLIVMPVTLKRIEADYPQTAVEFPTTDWDDIKSDLKVTAFWSDGSYTVLDDSDYLLVGTLAIGECTIHVHYDNKTAPFTVNIVPKDITIDVISPVTALTPIENVPYSERRVAFAISIPALSSAETVRVALADDVYGLSLIESTTVTGPSETSLTLRYNGTAEVTNQNVGVGLTVSTYGYNLTGSPAVSVTIHDGQAAERAIPVNSSNITHFNAYAGTPLGLSKHYSLMENVTLAPPVPPAVSNWTPIGTYNPPFTGTFDGREHAITGITINAPDTNNQGMFGNIGNIGIVKNLSLVNNSIAGGSTTGGLVGTNNGTVEYCTINGTVTGNITVGGLAGNNSGTVENSTVTGTVTGSSFQIGGVAGHNSGTVRNSYSSASVTSAGATVGGVAGVNQGIVQNSYSTGNVIGTDAVGGVVGMNNYGTVQYSYSTGIISSDIPNGPNNYTGGVVGVNSSTSILENNMALNPSVTGRNSNPGYYGRIVGGSHSLPPAHNYAWNGMTLLGNPVSSETGPETKHGGDISAAQARTRATWETAGFTFGGNSPWVWNENEGMPSLQGIGSVQAWPPHLP